MYPMNFLLLLNAYSSQASLDNRLGAVYVSDELALARPTRSYYSESRYFGYNIYFGSTHTYVYVYIYIRLRLPTRNHSCIHPLKEHAEQARVWPQQRRLWPDVMHRSSGFLLNAFCTQMMAHIILLGSGSAG